MMSPIFSVIIPCYNQGHFLAKAVESVLAQTCRDWECIIIDDGSTDDTAMVAAKFNLDDRIRYIHQKNRGLSAARNTGLDAVKGMYIQFLDADDFIDPDKFSLSLNTPPGTEIVMSDFVMFTDDDNKLPMPFKLKMENFTLKAIITDWDVKFVFPPHSGIFKKNIFDSLRFDESVKAREDWLMWVNIFSKQPTTFFIDKVLAHYRVSPASMSKNKDLMDESLIKVYRLAYNILPPDAKEYFFTAAMNAFSRLLSEHKKEIVKARNSKSYRIGNFIVKSYNKARGKR